MTSARDARDCQQVARQTALRHFEDAKKLNADADNLIRYAPPCASDPTTHDLNMRLAVVKRQLAETQSKLGHLHMEIAAVFDEHAVELEQGRGAA